MAHHDIPEEKTEFVDREGEMALLESMFEQAKMGDGSVLMIYGDIGVGKTRLMMEFGRRVEEEGGAFIHGRCSSQDEGMPYAPITKALDDYSMRAIESDVGMGMGLMGFTEAADAVSTSLMGFASTEERAADVASLMLEKEKMFREVLEQLTEVSREKTVVLFIDDIHRADRGTLQMFSFLATSVSDSRIMMCATYRPDEMVVEGGEHPLKDVIKEISGERRYIGVKLQPLEKDALSIMIGNLLGKEEVPEKLCDALYDETGGNPLFVEEVLRSLIEEGVLERGLQNWDESIDIISYTIPSTIVDVLEKRIANLSNTAKRVLRYASIAGNEVELELLLETCGMEEEEVLDGIEELIDSGIISEAARGDRIVLTFTRKHAPSLISEGLTLSRKLIINRKLGYSMEKLYGERGEYIYSLARHFLEGQVYDRASRYLILAGDQSMKRLALGKALNYYMTALNIIAQHMNVEESKEDIMLLSRRIGELLMGESRWEEAREHFRRGLSISEEAGDKSYISFFKRSVADALRNIGDYEEAEKLYDEALDIAIELDDSKGIAEANRGLGYIHWRKGEFKDAISHFNEAIASAMRIDDSQLMARIFIELGNTYNQRGDLDKALDYYNRSMEALREFGNYQELARALNNAGDIYLRKGDWENAIESFEKCKESAEKARNRNFVAWALFNGAEAYAKSGEPDVAERYAQEGLDICRDMNDRVGEHGALKALAIAKSRKGEAERAVEIFEKALAIADEMKIPYEKATSLMELAEAYHAMGDAAQEKKTLKEALEIFEGLGAEQDIRRARERLEALKN